MSAVNVVLVGMPGMLGQVVAEVISADPDMELVGLTRSDFDARTGDVDALLDATRPGMVVNAIGVLACDIDPGDPESVAQANEVNGEFPRRLAAAAGERGARVIHISTDGVFSGAAGPYTEDASPDAGGVYAESKSRGEAPGEHVTNIRCSIVGTERREPRSLLGWLLSQPPGASVPGFTNQRWNGVTTLAFAKVCRVLAAGEPPPPSPLHLVPADSLTKAELLEAALRAFGRDDVTVEPREADIPADRTLATLHAEESRRLWRAAGYGGPPSIEELLRELAER